MAFETVQIPYEQTPLLTGYISNTSNPDKIFSEEALENMLAEKDAINRRNQEATERAERDYKVNTALNIGGGVLQLGSALIPFGGLGTVAGTKLLSPLVGKAIGSAIGRGVASGSIGGGLFGMGDAISQAKPIGEIAKESLEGLTIGGLTGGLLGGVGGKIGQGLAKRNLRKTGLDPNGEYFDNYIQPLYDFDRNLRNIKGIQNYPLLNNISLSSQPLKEYRALLRGLGSPSGKGEILLDRTNPWHVAQNDIIQKSNPMLDDYHTGIRSADDILNIEDAFNVNNFSGTPDFTFADAVKARRDGYIKVYSSKDIVDGAFVTPSKMEAQSYAGENPVKEKIVPINDIAWNSSLEGQYAPLTHAKYNLSRDPLNFTGKEVIIDGKRYPELNISKKKYRELINGFNNSTSRETQSLNTFEKPIADTKYYLLNNGFNEPVVTWRELIDRIQSR